MGKTISIIVPVYNEERTVGQLLRQLIDQSLDDWTKEIIVVNDGSTDESERNILAQIDSVIYLKHDKTLGKGAAIKTGLERVSGRLVLIQDADLEYNPADIPKILAQLDEGAVIFGSRNLQSIKSGYTVFVLGNLFFTFLVNVIFKTGLTDVFTCYKLIPTNTFRSLKITSRGFAIEMEITVKLLARGAKIREVPIRYTPRTFKEGKKFTVLRALTESFWNLLWLLRAAWGLVEMPKKID